MQPENVDPSESLASLVDEVAAKMAQVAAPLTFRAVQSADEKAIAYRLRYQAVIERGWARPEEFPDEMERDCYDGRSIHILGWHGDIAVATARVVLPIPGALLPTEEAFSLTVEPRGKVTESGRLVVSRTHSSSQHRIIAALLGQSWLEARARGYQYFCGNVSSGMLRLYKRVGMFVTLLGPPRPYWGEERYPLLFDPQQSAATLIAHWNSQ
jgi:N-acyl-L-homoserine lactone synthetase